MGTRRFIPPERFHRQSLPQGDIYSLGLTPYELLTLEPAFRAPDPGRLIKLASDPSLRALTLHAVPIYCASEVIQ